MAYDIYIGQAVPTPVEYPATLKGIVAAASHPDAPDLSGHGPGGHVNHVHPSYGGWSDFCDAAGLYGMFFGDGPERGGLFRTHPGIATIGPDHLDRVRGALADKGDNLSHHHLMLLRWLEWWMSWALRTCQNPSIFNQ